MGITRHSLSESEMIDDTEGKYVEFDDALAEIERLRDALRAALPALRMAYKGGHGLTDSDYSAYKTACELVQPNAHDKGR